MRELNQELIEDWKKDLLENGHLQGKYVLKSTDGKFCCLGRLVELITHGEWSDDIDPANGVRGVLPPRYISGNFNRSATMIPVNIIRFLEEHSLNPDLMASDNDHGFSYQEIVEKHFD